MAYAAAVTINDRPSSQGRVVTISVTETEARDTSEWSTLASAANTVTVNGTALANGDSYRLPMAGRVVLYQATRTAGTGTTVQPRIGKAAAWSDSTQNAMGGQSSAAAYVNNAVPLAYSYAVGQACILYGRSTPPSSATDHSISTILVIDGDYE